jgi:hypothetical protein
MEGEKYIKNSIDLFKGQFKINGGNNFCGMKEKSSESKKMALKMKVQEEKTSKEMEP